MSFINFNNRSDSQGARYTKAVVKEALLKIETKNEKKVDSLLEGLAKKITLNEALELFSQKLLAMSVLDEARSKTLRDVNESAEETLADDVNGELFTAWFDGTVSVTATTTNKTWDDGVPVLKELARGRSKTINLKIKGEFSVVHDVAHGWFYFTDGNTWYGLHQDDGYTDIIDLPFNTQYSESEAVDVNEARSIKKIQTEFDKVVADMAATVASWKSAEGDSKTQLLDKLKSLTQKRNDLTKELDLAIMGKDRNVELAGALESVVNEGRVKQFEMDYANMVKDIKKGYGWIDPDYVAQTWDNSSDSIDFELVRDEIFDRLIAAGLLAHADDNNPEEAGKKIKSAKELYAFENVEVTEAKFVKDFNRDVLKAKTKEEVLELYPNAEFFIGKSDHFFGELDDNLFFKAYYTKAQEEFEIKSVYSEKGSNYVHLYNESVVTEAKKYEFKDLAKAWEFVYGEDMEDEYAGFYQEVTGKYKNKVTKKDVADIWQKLYGEDIEAEYDGFYNEIKENLDETNRLEESVVNEAFFRMSNDTIGNELYAASQALTTYYDWLKAGNDSGKGESIDHVISLLKKCKRSIKRFNDKEETIGTEYESPALESVVTEAKNTIGLAFKDEDDYTGFVEFIKDENGSIKKDFGWDSKTKSWEVIMDVKVLDSIYGEGTPGNKESGWYGGLPGDFESVIIESVVTESDEQLFEATVEMDAMDPDNKDFLKFLKKNRVKIIDKKMEGPAGGQPVITMQGKRKDLETVLADEELGWADPDLAEYIEESTVTKAPLSWETLIERVNRPINENLRSKVKTYIKRNEDELNALADSDNWDVIYDKMRSEFDIEEGTEEDKDLIDTFKFTF